MTDDLRELYQETILDHNKKPRNFGVLSEANRQAEGYNPLCGDQLKVYVQVDEQGGVQDISFEGSGCAISRASASLMTEAVKDRPRDEVDRTFNAFHELLTAAPNKDFDTSSLQKLAVFSGVREFPIRVKCATLAWHTLKAALENQGETAVTE